MNRREFLKSLAAIGTSLAIDPSVLARASTTEIDTAWQALVKEPRVFFVGDCGALSSWFGPDYPTCRQSLFGLDNLPSDPEQLLGYIEANQRAEDEMVNLFDSADESEVGAARDWREWLASSEDVRCSVWCSLSDWLADDPDGYDWEVADLRGYTGRGDALQFFQQQADTAELLNIQIIMGCHPGSSYYAAELQIGIEEANALAEAKGIPIRFEHDAD